MRLKWVWVFYRKTRLPLCTLLGQKVRQGQTENQRLGMQIDFSLGEISLVLGQIVRQREP